MKIKDIVSGNADRRVREAKQQYWALLHKIGESGYGGLTDADTQALESIMKVLGLDPYHDVDGDVAAVKLGLQRQIEVNEAVAVLARKIDGYGSLSSLYEQLREADQTIIDMWNAVIVYKRELLSKIREIDEAHLAVTSAENFRNTVFDSRRHLVGAV